MIKAPPPGNKYDCFEHGGNKDLAHIEGVVENAQEMTSPVRLQRGNPSWGAIHIAQKHAIWLNKNKLEVQEMIWLKLQHAGTIYNSEENNKIKIDLRNNPPAMMVLRFIQELQFFTVVTLYPRTGRIDGVPIGRYPGNGMKGPAPNLRLPMV